MQQRLQRERGENPDSNGDEVIDFGNGVTVPAEIHRTVTGKSIPYDVALTLTFQDGRYEVAALQFRQRPGGDPVSGTKLRQVPVDRLVQQVMSEWLPRRKAPPRSGRRLVRPGQVVSLYKLAWALHLPPTKTVAERLGMTQGSAEQAVVAARAAGQLPATQPGKAMG